MFNRRCQQVALALLLAQLAIGAAADDLRGENRLLCSALQATVCLVDGDCAVLAPSDLNIPQFIEIDIKKKKLATTAASGENRESFVDIVNRTEERLVMQGYENGRAYSLLIHEMTGQASFASVADDRSVMVFAACTPL